MKKIIFLISILLILSACQTEDIIKEPITYLTYEDQGFSVKYPDWDIPENTDNTNGVSRTKGYCTVMINSNQNPAKQLYSGYLDSLKKAPSTISYENDDNKYFIKSKSTYLQYTMVSETKIKECNDKSHLVSIACIDEVTEYNEVKQLYQTVLNSIDCEEDISEPLTFIEEDFETTYPNWNQMQGLGEESILGVSAGACSFIVNKYNALPEDLYNWITDNLGKEDLIISSDKDSYSIRYNTPYEENNLISETKIIYCNYQSYMPIFVCIDELEEEKLKETFLSSAICTQEYEVPTPEIPEIVQEEEPETIEEIEQIVKTDAADEFGIDAEVVVYFINGNTFFTKIMADFPNSNLVFEDPENNRNLELKIFIGENGKVTSVEDGAHTSSDVTVKVPLIDALNIVNNAANLNPLNLLAFAVNVKTEPENIKNEVIQKVLKGEYN